MGAPTMERRKSDFFLSRRGSVAEIAREVADVLTERGYTVIVQDYDIPLTANFVEAMHEAIKNSRDLVVLFTSDYETSPYTRKEFTSFEADRALSGVERRVVILRCENAPLRGLFAPNVYQDLVGIDDPQERKRRIIAAVEGRSQAQKPPPRPFVGVPPRVANFTGRATELDRLDAILLGGGKPAAITQISGNIGRAAVQGLGGVGKTSLAVEYAHRYRDLYAGVWWCPAENRLDLIAGLAAVAKHMDANAWGDSEKANLEDAAKRGLRSLAEQRATHLLVYDNVTSPSDIADLLPAAGARLLITSRFPDWTGWAEEVGLDMLSLGEATTFVQARAGRSDAAGASTIARAVGQLPLALDHAAAYCKRTQISFVDYAARVTQLITTLPSGTVYPRSVAATFDLAIAGAIASCQAAEGLMAYLAHCGPERIPTALVEGVTDDEATRTAALLALGDVSLIKADPYKDGTAAWTVHRLVQGVARTRAKAEGFEAQALQLLIERLAEIYPADGFDNRESWPLCARLTPHVFASCASGIPDEGSRMAQLRSDLLRRAGKFCRGGSYYREFSAEWLLRTALAISENALGPEHPQTARCLNNLALLWQGYSRCFSSLIQDRQYGHR